MSKRKSRVRPRLKSMIIKNRVKLDHFESINESYIFISYVCVTIFDVRNEINVYNILYVFIICLPISKLFNI